MHAYRWWWWLVLAVLAGLLLVWWLLRIFLVPAGAPWREHVLASASTLEHELERLLIRRRSPIRRTKHALSTRRGEGDSEVDSEHDRSIANAVCDHLQRARAAAGWPSEARKGQADQVHRSGREFVDWWTGASVESAYVNLHEAEIALAQLLPEDEIRARIPEALARLQTMDVTDPRRLGAERQLAATAPRSQVRAAFQSAVRTGLELKDQQHDRLRGFRNIT